MSGKRDDDDVKVDGRVQDGWQYAIHLDSGATVYLRDRDNISAVGARIDEAAGGQTPAARRVQFSGARGYEGEMEPEGEEGEAPAESESVIGPIRGKGSVDASRVVAFAYSEIDGPGAIGALAQAAAFEAAAAWHETNRIAMVRQIEDQIAAQAKAQAEPEAGAEGEASEGKKSAVNDML